MNFGRGFSIPQENDSQRKEYWMPVTPGKLISERSNPVPVDGNQLETTNWSELMGIYGGFLGETTNYNVGVQNLDPVGLTNSNGDYWNWDDGLAKNRSSDQHGGSFMQNSRNGGAGWDGNLLAEMFTGQSALTAASVNGVLDKKIPGEDMPAFPNSYSQVDSNWIESNSATLLPANQPQNLSSKQRINVSDSLQQINRDRNSVPYCSNFNLNSPPRSEIDAASSATTLLKFAPVTPEQGKQLENHRLSEIPNFSVDESSSQEKDKQEKLVRNESPGNHCDELLEHIVESSSAAISTPLKEKNSYAGDDQGIDINKTPQLKPPRRRKHRPKVVVEGKPKRTRKPRTPKSSTPNETPPVKRKYVRKKDLKTSTTPQAEVTNEVIAPTVGAEAKSCRRVLNFDLESQTRNECRESTSHQVESYPENRRAFNLNLDSQAVDFCTWIKKISATKSAMPNEQQNGHIAENQQVTPRNPTSSSNQMPAKYIPLQQHAPTAPAATVKEHNLNVIARNMNMRNATPSQNSGKNGYSLVHQHHIQGKGIGQTVVQANSSHANLERRRQLILLKTAQLSTNDMSSFDERRESGRENCHGIEQTHPSTVNLMRSPLSCQEMVKAGERNCDSSNHGTGHLETLKRKRTMTVKNVHAASRNIIAAVKDCLQQVETRGVNGVHTSSLSQINDRLNIAFERENTSKKLNNWVNETAGNWCIQRLAAEQFSQKQHNSSELHLHSKSTAEKITERSAQVHNLNFLTAITNRNLLSPIPPEKVPTFDQVRPIETLQTKIAGKKQTMEPASSKQASSKDKVIRKEHKDVQGYQSPCTKARGIYSESLNVLRYQEPSGKATGPLENQFSVDYLTYQLKGLNINCRRDEIARQEQSALVPYKGESTIVPYEGFDPIKRRKPRPKVDLDPETNRIWNLLMGKEGNENTEATNVDKEKWWEEERKVFHGRVDSFIARMHLVQGDRRFSQWKGSVVDSVIGVFLTQNVSDHLSSSAFMSLAAKFPLRSMTISKTCYQNQPSVLGEEQEMQILGPNGIIECHERIARQPLYNRSFMTSCESSEQRTENFTSGSIRSSSAHNRRAEEVIFPQTSFDSSILQTTDEIRSSSGSNSEAEDQITGCQPNKSHSSALNNLLQTERSARFQEFYSQVVGNSLPDERLTHGHQQSVNRASNWQYTGSDNDVNQKGSSGFPYPINPKILHVQESSVSSGNFWLNKIPGSRVSGVECFSLFGEESISSFPSTAAGNTKRNGVDYMSNRTGRVAEIEGQLTVQQRGIPMIQASAVGPYTFFNEHAIQQGNLHPGPHTRNNQHAINNHQEDRSKTFQLESTTVSKPPRPAETLARGQTPVGQQLPGDPKFSGQMFDVEERIASEDKLKFLQNKVTEANARKRKAESEKKNVFDWDSLRKQVQSSSTRKERSKDAMDSLDYEAVRRADVNEISDAIKERGMNNMLADRIQDFLNRIVREHGGIDLEWLRDVPPDKTKDYLLSIRGLGLKSVECVRLLTLHHLAFPVDTNVGRIAVRLGWVPLQPLPESLQLHLLELYPMLETIQKYLWPRLCKLDQRTLYELHYQMITFGKVFCTKSKPNCNACPMRGECRHFASAFASARLALPGPEERGMTSSSAPLATGENHAAAVKPLPLPLPPAENNLPKEAWHISSKCEPIVEEPATPEPLVEVAESDIEDFYEDPDEIPACEIDMEEFTLNLQTYMQQNMELQEGDMSKALVALHPQAASIPATKLKNMSRLRTEHQVYELPDSHPLLKELDRREPDDPSPYLLAIWTPGETANSIQPPESMCGSQESGKLCDEKTCFSCNCVREANLQTVRGTLLVPCRTAMRGSFPLNGTYFQVNEMFADHESSLNPIDVPRSWLWNLPRRTVYFGTSVSSIFKGLTTEGIQYCFWRGFVCVRGFDQKTRAPRPLMARLHFPASRLAKNKNEGK